MKSLTAVDSAEKMNVRASVGPQHLSAEKLDAGIVLIPVNPPGADPTPCTCGSTHATGVHSIIFGCHRDLVALSVMLLQRLDEVGLANSVLTTWALSRKKQRGSS